MDHLVVDGPEPVEIQYVLIVLYHLLHFVVGLIAHNMVNLQEVDLGHHIVKGLSQRVWLEARQEQALVVLPFHEGMSGITISLDTGQNDGSILILEFCGLHHRCGSLLHRVIEDCGCILHGEGNILGPVTMVDEVFVHLVIGVPVVNTAQDEEGTLVIRHNV